MSSTTATLGEFRDEKDLQIAQLKADLREREKNHQYVVDFLNKEAETYKVKYMDMKAENEKLKKKNEKLKDNS